MTIFGNGNFSNPHFDAAEHLKQEVIDLADHNRALKREVVELRKERKEWRETQRQASLLETTTARLSEDLDSLRAECNRLRRKNEELARQLEHEAAESQTARIRWAEREFQLTSQAKADREKLKDFLALQSIPASYDEEELLKYKPVLAGEDEETQTLKQEIAEKDAFISRQNEEVRELRLVLEAVVAHANQCGGFDRRPFNYGEFVHILRSMANEAPEDGYLETSYTSTSSSADCDGHETCDTDSLGRLTPTPDNIHALTIEPGNSLSFWEEASAAHDADVPDSDFAMHDAFIETSFTISDSTYVDATFKHLESLPSPLDMTGESIPLFTPEATSLLQSRLAAYGLRTDGNRKARRKRLDRFKMQKKKEVTSPVDHHEDKVPENRANKDSSSVARRQRAQRPAVPYFCVDR
ncbi:hypothetical protein HDU67_000029 [Dinochytrium kinnereticum]|nr:hypothetical protein HDU67_000029 [Dinochytrium kinnereticum]